MYTIYDDYNSEGSIHLLSLPPQFSSLDKRLQSADSETSQAEQGACWGGGGEFRLPAWHLVSTHIWCFLSVNGKLIKSLHQGPHGGESRQSHKPLWVSFKHFVLNTWPVVDDVFTALTSVKVLIPHCKINSVKIKVLHWNEPDSWGGLVVGRSNRTDLHENRKSTCF